jgi:hypothetical protein
MRIGPGRCLLTTDAEQVDISGGHRDDRPSFLNDNTRDWRTIVLGFRPDQ